jgi:hypothetical protein
MRTWSRRSRAKLLIGGALVCATAVGSGGIVASVASANSSSASSTVMAMDQDGQPVTITETDRSNGYTDWVYTRSGVEVVRIKERDTCRGVSKGIAKVETLPSGGFLITGTVAHGATGLDILLQSGAVVHAPLVGQGAVEYSLFRVKVASAPASFNTLGVAIPKGCAQI